MTDRRRHLQATLRAELEAREADAFAHVATDRDPTLRYCRVDASDPVAVAFDGAEWLACRRSDSSDHPAERLAARLRERGLDGSILTPQTVPHDAALYIERAGFSLASTDAVDHARAEKTPGERERIERAQAAAGAGLRRAASVLADATVVDGSLAVDGDPLTPDRLRRLADEAVVAAGGFPAGNTAVSAGTDPDVALPAGEPIVVELAPQETDGYHGGLVRTFVVDGDGGWERRAHVAVTRALASARALLTADEPPTSAVEADLEAEVVAFGFEEGIETAVYSVGLERRERPADGDAVETGHVVRLEAAVTGTDGDTVRVADLLFSRSETAEWLEKPSRSLDPAAFES
ncbi:M24 family metallopeptidase [Natribaculum luteum]|uniref:M24 family metallopeptidase n=1 Tax=Natribaculum luteum TaxID=1586232 RepID=A0ABD5NZJ8_9EURY|nr:M24 family metallopeptidase [Natribaculum luteum]